MITAFLLFEDAVGDSNIGGLNLDYAKVIVPIDDRETLKYIVIAVTGASIVWK